MDSILKTVRKYIGPAEDYLYFDPELIMSINTAFNVLNHGGIGERGFRIEDDTATWNDFVGDNNRALAAAVESYTCMSVKLDFDPPSNSFLVTRMKERIDELYWRMITMVDTEDTD